jgi:hypothetical protein
MEAMNVPARAARKLLRNKGYGTHLYNSPRYRLFFQRVLPAKERHLLIRGRSRRLKLEYRLPKAFSRSLAPALLNLNPNSPALPLPCSL